MNLSKRIAAIEAQAKPLAAEIERLHRRKVLGRFAMMRLLIWGFTHAESLDCLRESHKRRGRGESLADVPDWTGPHIFDDFQSFLAADSRASKLHRSILAFRADGEKWSDTIQHHAEAISALSQQLQTVWGNYFLEAERSDFLTYLDMMAAGMKRMGDEQKGDVKVGA